jgi:hypothetical protein
MLLQAVLGVVTHNRLFRRGRVPPFPGRHAPGEDDGRTFRVEEGVLKIACDRHPEFGGKLGHPFMWSGNYRSRPVAKVHANAKRATATTQRR